MTNTVTVEISAGVEVYVQTGTLIYLGKVVDADGHNWNAYDGNGDLVGTFMLRHYGVSAVRATWTEDVA